MKDICKGCSLTTLHFIQCAFVALGKEESCPCIECLVKPICIAACDKRGSIKNAIFKYNRTKRRDNEKVL
jgi:hypothetical protein